MLKYNQSSYSNRDNSDQGSSTTKNKKEGKELLEQNTHGIKYLFF